jgi:NCS1 family nucleobase:cation symporter-1
VINFRIGGFITGVIGIVMMPWKLIADPHGYIFTWLIAYSALLGAVGGIIICDYFVLRRTHLNLRDLFSPSGRYTYSGGVNYAAVIALVVAVAPCVPGFLHTVGLIASVPPIWDRLYTYAWFLTFALAFLLYGLLMIGNRSVKQEK